MIDESSLTTFDISVASSKQPFNPNRGIVHLLSDFILDFEVTREESCSFSLKIHLKYIQHPKAFKLASLKP